MADFNHLFKQFLAELSSYPAGGGGELNWAKDAYLQKTIAWLGRHTVRQPAKQALIGQLIIKLIIEQSAPC